MGGTSGHIDEVAGFDRDLAIGHAARNYKTLLIGMVMVDGGARSRSQPYQHGRLLVEQADFHARSRARKPAGFPAPHHGHARVIRWRLGNPCQQAAAQIRRRRVGGGGETDVGGGLVEGQELGAGYFAARRQPRFKPGSRLRVKLTQGE